MVDWTGRGVGTGERYRRMAERELHGVSPTYEAICLGVSEDADLLARLDELPPAKRQPNLLLAAVRFLGGSVDTYTSFRSWTFAHWDGVAATMRVRRTQTNEARRCATLLPVLAALPQPLALLEVGASAGLCLYPDRWAYRYATSGGVHRVGAGAATLDCAVTGPAPLPAAVPTVVWRAGLDLNPLDVRDGQDVRWLESLIWPEQADRFDRLHTAVGLARADPPQLVRGDLLTDLAPLAGQAPADATLVVFHSAVLAYVDVDDRATFERQVGALNAVWVSNEAPAVVRGTDAHRDGPSRFVLARDGAALARTGPHGHTLDWLDVAQRA